MNYDEDDVMIVGAGVVGQATGKFLESLGCNPMLVDINEELIQNLRHEGRRANTRPITNLSRVTAFICVPTPAEQGNTHNLSAIRAALVTLARLQGLERLTIVIRSTVIPGTCAQLNDLLLKEIAPRCRSALVYMPEFLRQATAEADALSPRAIVVASTDALALAQMRRLLSPLADRLVVLGDPREAEMIKIAHNAWNAAKISFWNEMYRIGVPLGLNMPAVARVVAVTAEASWNPEYGLKGGKPFGGSCLPKDLSAFIAYVEEQGIAPKMLLATQEVNRIELMSSGRER